MVPTKHSVKWFRVESTKQKTQKHNTHTERTENKKYTHGALGEMFFIANSHKILGTFDPILGCPRHQLCPLESP